jgi:hypothetical protein
MILLFPQRIIFCSPELHILEKKGLTVVQKLQVLAPPEQNSKQIIVHGFLFQFLCFFSKENILIPNAAEKNILILEEEKKNLIVSFCHII